MTDPPLNEALEWRIPIWAPAVSRALDRAAAMLRSDAKVLEIGYNSGMMSCYMAARYGWNIVGYDIYDSAKDRAVETSRRYGLEGMTDFHETFAQPAEKCHAICQDQAHPNLFQNGLRKQRSLRNV